MFRWRPLIVFAMLMLTGCSGGNPSPGTPAAGNVVTIAIMVPDIDTARRQVKLVQLDNAKRSYQFFKESDSPNKDDRDNAIKWAREIIDDKKFQDPAITAEARKLLAEIEKGKP